MDYHINTAHLGRADATMNIDNIVSKGSEMGYDSIGACNHLHTKDEIEFHETLKQEITDAKKNLKIYLGITVVLQGLGINFPLDENVSKTLEPDYVFGAIHGTYISSYDRDLLIARHHALLCKTARDPHIDVVAHPWWFPPQELQHRRFPKFDNLSVIPDIAHSDFAKLCIENKTAIEANARLIMPSEYYPESFREQYIQYLKFMTDQGVYICAGSDAHTITELDRGKRVIEELKKAGISQGCFWDPTMGKTSRIRRKKGLHLEEGNIVLVGFMGAGKTEVGKILSNRLNMRFVDMDHFIEGGEGRTIREIFEQDGEEYFRAVESDVCKEISALKNSVVSTGGGVVLKRQNMVELKSNAVVVYLLVDVEDALKRTSGQTHRPLLNLTNVEKKIEELISLRKPYYNQADWTVSTKDKKPEDIADEIIKLLGLKP